MTDSHAVQPNCFYNWAFFFRWLWCNWFSYFSPYSVSNGNFLHFKYAPNVFKLPQVRCSFKTWKYFQCKTWKVTFYKEKVKTLDRYFCIIEIEDTIDLKAVLWRGFQIQNHKPSNLVPACLPPLPLPLSLGLNLYGALQKITMIVTDESKESQRSH